MVLFWQEGYGSDAVFGIAETGAVTFWIPLMVFAFLFGLSMDYEVFILSRIREEYDAGASTDEAVVLGIGRTGRLVTSAALILFLAFAALASGPGHRPQGDGDRPRLRHPARRHHRPLGARPVAGVAVRLVELEAPGVRAAPAGRAVASTPGGSRARSRLSGLSARRHRRGDRGQVLQPDHLRRQPAQRRSSDQQCALAERRDGEFEAEAVPVGRRRSGSAGRMRAGRGGDVSHKLTKPVVAATQGWVIGGGICMVMTCDLMVSADTTKFMYPEAKVGVFGGLMPGIVSRMPHKVAMELLLLGEEISVQARL